MTLYTIPDLVWQKEPDGYFSATNDFAYGWIEPSDYGGFIWGVELIGAEEDDTADTLELAQSAANDWYKAKMAEGLKVATAEELRAAIKEMEPPQ